MAETPEQPAPRPPPKKPNRGVRRRARVTTRTAKGRLWELAGRPAAAFEHYAAALRAVPDSRAALGGIDRLAGHRRAPITADPAEPDTAVFFIGYPRSGHSLIGSLLDAHPDMVISHELNALRFLAQGVPASTVFRYMQYNAQVFGAKGRNWTVYDYTVPSQWQGSHRRLTVLGDKRGGGTTRTLQKHPGILDDIDRLVPCRVHFVHVVRDPFDTIATWAYRHRIELDKAADRFFSLVDTVSWFKSTWDGARLSELSLEAFIADPADHLRQLGNELGVADMSADYLTDCTALINARPHRSGERVAWPRALRAEIRRRAAMHDFLAPYTEPA